MPSYPRQEGIPEDEQLNDHRIQMPNQPNEGEDQMSEERRQRFHRRMALIICVGIIVTIVVISIIARIILYLIYTD